MASNRAGECAHRMRQNLFGVPGALIRFINEHPQDFRNKRIMAGLQLLWITPLRAMAKDIARAMQEVIEQLNMAWRVVSKRRYGRLRNGEAQHARKC